VIDPKTRAIAIGGSLVVLLMVIELVRRRRLKEEYSVLWIVTALVMLVLSVWYELLVKITSLIGAVLPTSTLFFFGLVFVLLMLLHFSVRVSLLERRITALAQEVGLMNARRKPEEASELEEDEEAEPIRGRAELRA
jgi:hypothetical protein